MLRSGSKLPSVGATRKKKKSPTILQYYSLAHLTTLSAAEIRALENNELERMWKKVAMA
jgi:hypothetical protein